MTYHPTPDIHVYIDQATAVFKARVDLPGGATYPVTSLPFKNVTLGNWADVQADMTLLLGSADGLDDLGRVRVQNILTSTTIPVGRVSRGLEDGQATISDNAYITILDDYRVWSKLPYETLTDPPTSYKDSDVPVEVGGQNYNIEIPPVAIMGTAFAGYIDSVTGKLRVAFDGSLSYAMADGATITAWGWVIPGSATIVSGAIDASTLTVDFEPGFYWVQLSVTDSNGKGHSTRRPVLAVDPANDVTLQHAAIESQRFTMMGQTLTLRLYGDAPRTTYPDGALVMVWFNAPSSPADRSHIKFVGWIQSESWGIRSTPRGVVRDTLLTCLDVAGRLDTLPGFPQALERSDSEALWSYMPGLHISRALHYLLHWHSTALVVADFFLPANGDDYTAMRLDSTGATLFDQTNSRALSMVPDHYLTCNPQGQMAVVEDWMLIDEGDRPAASVILTEDDLSDIRADYTRPPKVYALRSSAVVVSTDWQYDAFGEETLPLAFSVAPHTDAGAFGQGANEVTTGEKLTISQTALNVCEGHRYARLNSRDGLYQITLAHVDDVWSLIPALFARVQINVGATYAAQRGVSWTQAVGLVKELTLRYQATREGTVLAPTLTFERETAGPPAITYIPPESGEPDYESEPPPVPTVPPPMGLRTGVEQVAGIGIDGYIYRTSDFQTLAGAGGPTWDRVDTTIADTIYSWVVDPFSPGYAPGATSGSIDGWIVNDTDIYRVTDLFGTPAATSVHTFATATTAASFHWRTIQASFGGYFAEGVNPWLLCVSYYGATSGHTGTWATHSLDGGLTWSTEVQISAYYNTGTPARFNPIGVYTSPKTPGLAYTAAHLVDETVSGFVSTNWGATWAASSFIEPGLAQAGSIHLPWPGNDSEELAYFGVLEAPVAEGTAAELMPAWAHYDASSSTLTQLADGPSALISAHAEVENGGSDATGNQFLMYGPPPDAVRVNSRVDWLAYRSSDGGFGSQSLSLNGWPHSGITRTSGISNYVDPASNSSSSGSFAVVHERNNLSPSASWGINNTNLDTQPFSSTNRVQYSVVALLASVQSGHHWIGHVQFTWTITEIELENGTIYTPVDAVTNRSFRLKQSTGGAISDISPVDTAISYGVNRGPFGVRTFDSNRQYLLLAGIGNDTSTDPADDKHGVFISDDFGTTWTNIVAPIADSGAPAGRPAFEAAFGGDSQNIVYIWGPEDYISYSDDFGATLDSKTGNLAALGASGWVGIAGGPG